MMADVDQKPCSPDQDVILTCSEADDGTENPANYKTALNRTPMARDEKQMMSMSNHGINSNHGNKTMEELLKQQVKMQMKLIELLMATKSRDYEVNDHVGVTLGQTQPVVAGEEGNRQESVKNKVKFHLAQTDQVRDYRKARKRQRLASSENVIGGKWPETDDVLIGADFKKDGQTQRQNDEVEHKSLEYMDEELERIQRHWRDELIKDELRFKRTREGVEESDLTVDSNNEGPTLFGVKLQKVEDGVEEREERELTPTSHAQGDFEGKRERLQQHLLMKHKHDKNGWEKLRENEDDEVDRKRRRNSDKDPDLLMKHQHDKNGREKLRENEDFDIERKRRRNSEKDPDEKRARFLERNRAAVAKCRNKRKQQIANLETKVNKLNDTKVKLQTEVTSLRNEVIQLKQLLLAHKDCPVTKMQRKALQAQAKKQQQAAAAQAQACSSRTRFKS